MQELVKLSGDAEEGALLRFAGMTITSSSRWVTGSDLAQAYR
jgi:hypothetical protein